MGKIVAHIVPAKRKHGKGIAPYCSGLEVESRGSNLRPDCCSGEHAMLPRKCLVYQRDRGWTPAAKEKGADGNALGIFPFRRDGRTLACWGGKTRIGMRCRLGAVPFLAVPVNYFSFRSIVANALPPDIVVLGKRHVGEDCVFTDALHGIGVCFSGGSW